MNKFKLMLALLAAPSMVLASCGEDPAVVDDKVSSVKVSLAKTTLYEGETTKASANVTAKDGVDKSVTWSSSNTAVATVDAEGNVTAHKKGSAKIIATSKYDNTKKGEKTLTVKEDQGFDPSWIEAGFEYSKAFPVSQIEEFLGEGDYDIVEPASLVGGSYFKVLPEDSSGPACAVVIIDGVVYEDYASALFQAGFSRIYYGANGGLEAVDPSGKYTVAMYADADETTYEEIAPTYLEFYKSEDVWDSPDITSDIAWDEAKIDSEDSYEIEMINEFLPLVPFVAMGEDYTIEWAYDYSELYQIIELLYYYGIIDESSTEEEIMYYAEYFGYEGPVEYLSIHDYSICEPFDGYDAVLEGAGFELVEDEESGDYYSLISGLNEYCLYYGFGYQGNYVEMEKYAAVLDAFPKSYVDEFVASVVASKYEVPAYEETEGASFMAQIFEDEMDIMIDSAEISEFEAYKDKLELAGFEVEYTPASEQDYPGIYATKGRIVIEMELQQEEGDDDYLDYGPVSMYIYANEEKHEEKGIYLPETTNAVLKASSIELEPEMVDLDDANLTWTSSDEGIATVSDGVVTMLTAGEVNITVTTDVETSEPGVYYSATTKLVISEKPDFAPVLAGLNESLALYGGTEVLTVDDIPEIDCVEYSHFDGFSYYGCYIIQGFGPEETNASYTEKIEGLGFEVLVDDYNNLFYQTEEYDVLFNLFPADEEGPACFQVCVYFQEVASEGATFDFSEISETSGSINGFSFTTSKAGGQSAPAYNDNKLELRLYANNTITFTSEEPMTEIFFDANTCGESKATGTFVSASTGSVSEVDGGFLWEGNATEVTLTVGGSGQIHINLIDINGGSGGGGGDVPSGDFDDILDEIESAYSVTLKYDSEDDSYFSEKAVASSSSKTMMQVVTDAVNKLPDVFSEEYEAPYEDYWDEDETDPGVFACYLTEDWSVVIQFGAWVEDGQVWLQIVVYEI